MVMQVSIAKQLKSILGVEDSTKIGFLVHVSTSCVRDGYGMSGLFVLQYWTATACECLPAE